MLRFISAAGELPLPGKDELSHTLMRTGSGCCCCPWENPRIKNRPPWFTKPHNRWLRGQLLREFAEIVSSNNLILPSCQLEKTFTKDGEVLMKDGGTTADNLCDCQQHYRYVGATFAECQQGFGQGSLCACELCASGKKRDDTQAGLSRAYVTIDSAAPPLVPVPRTEPLSRTGLLHLLRKNGEILPDELYTS